MFLSAVNKSIDNTIELIENLTNNFEFEICEIFSDMFLLLN